MERGTVEWNSGTVEWNSGMVEWSHDAIFEFGRSWEVKVQS